MSLYIVRTLTLNRFAKNGADTILLAYRYVSIAIIRDNFEIDPFILKLYLKLYKILSN